METWPVCIADFIKKCHLGGKFGWVALRHALHGVWLYVLRSIRVDSVSRGKYVFIQRLFNHLWSLIHGNFNSFLQTLWDILGAPDFFFRDDMDI